MEFLEKYKLLRKEKFENFKKSFTTDFRTTMISSVILVFLVVGVIVEYFLVKDLIASTGKVLETLNKTLFLMYVLMFVYVFVCIYPISEKISEKNRMFHRKINCNDTDLKMKTIDELEYISVISCFVQIVRNFMNYMLLQLVSLGLVLEGEGSTKFNDISKYLSKLMLACSILFCYVYLMHCFSSKKDDVIVFANTNSFRKKKKDRLIEKYTKE